MVTPIPATGVPHDTGPLIEILQVTPSESEYGSLRAALHHPRWSLNRVLSCEGARKFLRQRAVSVVVCAADLADGGWKDLLYEIAEMAQPPRLIVSSRRADIHLWGEVLNLGGYDVLDAPFAAEEVVGVISAAWRSWRSAGNRSTGWRAAAGAVGASTAA